MFDEDTTQPIKKWKKILPKPNDLTTTKEANIVINDSKSVENATAKIAIWPLSTKEKKEDLDLKSEDRRKCIWLERRVIQLQKEILNLKAMQLPRILTRMNFMLDRETIHPLCQECRKSKNYTFTHGSLEQKSFWRPKEDCEDCKITHSCLQKIDVDDRLWNKRKQTENQEQ